MRLRKIEAVARPACIVQIVARPVSQAAVVSMTQATVEVEPESGSPVDLWVLPSHGIELFPHLHAGTEHGQP
jgi:hypothetical protein